MEVFLLLGIELMRRLYCDITDVFFMVNCFPDIVDNLVHFVHLLLVVTTGRIFDDSVKGFNVFLGLLLGLYLYLVAEVVLFGGSFVLGV